MHTESRSIIDAFSALLTPNEQEVRALIVPNDDPLTSGFSSFLSKQQRAGCRRYHHAVDRHAAMVCKGLWRLGAAVLLGCDPREVPLGTDEWKRPVLIGHDRAEMDLNVARTPTHCVLAVSRGIRVGVDIETIAPELVSRPLVQMIAHERDSVDDFLTDPARFFQYWAQKEAVLKADGRGLSIDPRSVRGSNDTHDDRVWSLCGCGDDSWHAAELRCPEMIKGAVAVDPVPSAFEQLYWSAIREAVDLRGSCARTHAVNP